VYFTPPPSLLAYWHVDSHAFRFEKSKKVNILLNILSFLPAAINEVDGLRHWNDNYPPSLPPLPPTICNIFKLF
jgi:hypothetical protein